MSEPMEDKRLEEKFLAEFTRLGWAKEDDLTKSFVWQLARIANDEVESIRQLLVQDPALERQNKEQDSLRTLVTVALNGLHWRDEKLTTIKELINGASMHPETGVSLVDDVRDLVKELARWKNSVPGSIKSYIAQVEHEKKEVAVLKAENSRLRELINEASGMMKLLDRKGQYESVTDWLAKAALDGTK